MNYSIPALNLISALYLVVMLAGSHQVPAEAIDKTRPFRYCLLSTLLGLFAETGAYFFDGNVGQTALQYLCNGLCIVLVDFIVFFYVLYLRGLLPNRSLEKYKMLTSVMAVLCVLSFIVNLIAIFSGSMFTITDGVFQAGPFYGYRLIISGIVFACIVYLFFSKYQTFGLKSRWLSFLFVLIV